MADETIWTLFEANADARPESVAVHDAGVDTTYGELRGRAETFADWLARRSLNRGDRVLFLTANSADYVAMYLGTLKAGGVVVAVNPEMASQELEVIVEDCRPSIAVLAGKATRLVETLLPLRQRIGKPLTVAVVAQAGELKTVVDEAMPVGETQAADPPMPERLTDLAQIIYTSGTTGRPKGVMLSHANLVANTGSIIASLSLTSADSVLVVLPFFYSYGNSLLMTHLAVGGRLVLAGGFVFWGQALDMMATQRCTGFAGVPSTFAMLFFRSDVAKRQFPDLRYLTCAGGGLPPAHVEQARTAFPDAELFLMYGQTEATARLSVLPPAELDRRPGSIGRGLPGVTLQVYNEENALAAPGEVGEVVARGPNLMLGYWNDEQSSRAVLSPEGLRTGDLGTVDSDGFITLEGRRDDLIKSGAYRISPHEIEDVILRHPSVAEVAVVGEPDEILGQVPVAYAVASGELDQAQILEHCRASLPRYKMPRAIYAIESLPKTATGKVRRKAIRDGGRPS